MKPFIFTSESVTKGHPDKVSDMISDSILDAYLEKNADNPATDEAVAAEVSAALKARIGVKPYNVIVHPDGGLNTRSEHKSKRIIDERKLDYSI